MTDNERVALDDAQIKHMTERFLNWRLPEDFNPDAGISFEPVFNKGTPYEHRHEPTGTNLFDYSQAKAMVRHMVEGLPAMRPTIPDDGSLTLDCASVQRLMDYGLLHRTDDGWVVGKWPSPRQDGD